MTIYATPFDPTTKRCTGASMPAGVDSFFEVMVRQGTPVHAGPRMLVYPEWAYSDFVLHIDRGDKPRLQSGEIGG